MQVIKKMFPLFYVRYVLQEKMFYCVKQFNYFLNLYFFQTIKIFRNNLVLKWSMLCTIKYNFKTQNCVFPHNIKFL